MTKGDASVPAISAASIIAKVTRDRLMRGLADEYPERAAASSRPIPRADESSSTRVEEPLPRYGWAENKAYGSASHRAAIARHDSSPATARGSHREIRS